MTKLNDIVTSPIPATAKGMPRASTVTPQTIGDQGWNVLREDMSFPIAVLRDSALRHNAAWMERFGQEHQVWLYPHGKTTMAPQIFDLQLQHGCRGITAANVLHAEIYLEHGVTSVFIANQVVGRQAIRRLAGLCERFAGAEFFLIVDSLHNVDELRAALGTHVTSGQLKLLVEIGAPAGRTGVRSAAEALALASSMAEIGMPCSGLEAFEGIYNIAERESAERSVRTLLEEICTAHAEIAAAQWFAPGTCFLSAGGSWFYDLVADAFARCGGDQATQTIIRAGCSISHDSGLCKRAYADLLDRGIIEPNDHFRPALEVWAQVQSQPEAGRAYANAGKRDVSYDIDLPVVEWWFRPGLHDRPERLDGAVQLTALNDQHAYLTFDDRAPLAIGDLVGLGVSHPCTTFDKWKHLYTVTDDYTVTGAITTFF